MWNARGGRASGRMCVATPAVYTAGSVTSSSADGLRTPTIRHRHMRSDFRAALQRTNTCTHLM